MATSNPKQIFETKIQSSQSIHWEYDAINEQYLHIDKSICNLTGHSLENWKSSQFRHKHIHEDDKDWAITFPEYETTFEKEYRIKSASGKIIWVRDTITVVKQPGLPYRYHGYMTDISDQKAVENAMQTLAIGASDDEDNVFFEECVKNISNVYSAKYAFIGILSEDKLRVKTLAVWANGELADNFEYDLKHTPCEDVLCMKKELIPTNVAGLYPKDELLVQMGVDSYFGTPLTPVKSEMTGLLSILDDEPMHLTSWTAPVLSLFASRISVELKKREQNTYLKQMMKESQAASIAKSEFLANMSHELRTPMHSILAFSDLGLRQHENAPRDKLGDYYSNIKNSASNLMLLINDLLDLSKLESGTTELIKEKSCLYKLTLNCIEEQRLSIETKKLTVTTTKDEISTGYFDRNKIGQVIRNLLSNAIKFSPNGSNINIKIFNSIIDHQNVIGFNIKDEGPGIPTNETESIFEKFIQSSLTKNGAGGTGLGLAISKEIIQLHHGNIRINQQPNSGASFEFTFPTDNN